MFRSAAAGPRSPPPGRSHADPVLLASAGCRTHQERQPASASSDKPHAGAGTAGYAEYGDAGYPEIEGEGWFAFIVPSGTPAPSGLLHREIAEILALPDVANRIAALGFELVGSTPEACAALFRGESAKWTHVIRAAGIGLRIDDRTTRRSR